MGFTDDCYTDGRDPSVTPSVLLLPMDFIAVTDRISPSVKLDNVVVKSKVNIHRQFSFYFLVVTCLIIGRFVTYGICSMIQGIILNTPP